MIDRCTAQGREASGDVGKPLSGSGATGVRNHSSTNPLAGEQSIWECETREHLAPKDFGEVTEGREVIGTYRPNPALRPFFEVGQ